MNILAQRGLQGARGGEGIELCQWMQPAAACVCCICICLWICLCICICNWIWIWIWPPDATDCGLCVSMLHLYLYLDAIGSLCVSLWCLYLSFCFYLCCVFVYLNCATGCNRQPVCLCCGGAASLSLVTKGRTQVAAASIVRHPSHLHTDPTIDRLCEEIKSLGALTLSRRSFMPPDFILRALSLRLCDSRSNLILFHWTNLLRNLNIFRLSFMKKSQ